MELATDLACVQQVLSETELLGYTSRVQQLLAQTDVFGVKGWAFEFKTGWNDKTEIVMPEFE